MVSPLHPCLHKLSDDREVLLVLVSVDRSKLGKILLHARSFKLVRSDASEGRLEDILKQTVDVCLVCKVLAPLNPRPDLLPDRP